MHTYKPKPKVKMTRTITFTPSEEVALSLERLTAPFSRRGRAARGLITFYVNAGLEQSICRPDFKPNTEPKPKKEQV